MAHTLGGKTFAELGLRLSRDYEYPASPSTRNYTMEIPNRHGLWDFGADMGAREFSLSCALFENTPAGLQKAMNALNAHLFDVTGRPKDLKLIFGFEPDKYYTVRLSDGVSLSRIIGTGMFSLPLTAYNPAGQLIALNNEITWASKDITFEMYNIKWGSRGGDAQTLNSPGYYYAWSNGSKNVRPIVTINGSADELTLTANSETLTLGPFTNDEIIIDGPTYSVTKNGADDLSFVSGNLGNFTMTPGENPIYIDGINFDVAVSAVFRDQYL